MTIREQVSSLRETIEAAAEAFDNPAHKRFLAAIDNYLNSFPTKETEISNARINATTTKTGL